MEAGAGSAAAGSGVAAADWGMEASAAGSVEVGLAAAGWAVAGLEASEAAAAAMGSYSRGSCSNRTLCLKTSLHSPRWRNSSSRRKARLHMPSIR